MKNTVIKEEPKGKRPHLRWEDCVKREVKAVDPEAKWREIAEDRIKWRKIGFTRKMMDGLEDRKKKKR